MNWLRQLLRPHPRPVPMDADLRRRIRASFDEAASDEKNFPREIDPRILHVRLILDHLEPIAPRRVLDIGCGKGRFARHVRERFPNAQVWGLDISTVMLGFAPAGIHCCAAVMTELPFPDHSFDAAYATESLEHAVDIELAVAEMCRVVRPGGRLAVIDKNAAHWGRFQTPEWELWFSEKELKQLLGHHCRRVSCQPISYWEDVKPDGLFLAWLAEK